MKYRNCISKEKVSYERQKESRKTDASQVTVAEESRNESCCVLFAGLSSGVIAGEPVETAAVLLLCVGRSL